MFLFKYISIYLCLLIGIIRLFVLKIIIDVLGLKSAILVFLFCVFPLPSTFLFSSYLLIGYLNFFRILFDLFIMFSIHHLVHFFFSSLVVLGITVYIHITQPTCIDILLPQVKCRNLTYI